MCKELENDAVELQVTGESSYDQFIERMCLYFGTFSRFWYKIKEKNSFCL